MSMKNINEVLRDADNRLDNFLSRKLIVWESPIDGSLEYRAAYFTDNAEAIAWETYMRDKYKELGIKIKVYTSAHHGKMWMEDRSRRSIQ